MTSGAVDCPIYDFGPFRLDPGERLLVRDGQSIPLTPRAFDLLVYLVERQGRLAEKQALMSALWPDTIVEEANLAFHISALRKVLDEGGKRESVIQTVPTKGYRFVAPVTMAIPIARQVQAPNRHGGRWPVVWVGCAIALALASIMLIRWRQASGGTAAPSATVSAKQLRIRKLTDNDQAADVAISPDGRYVVFVRGDGQSQSLWLRQIDTGTEVRIVEPDGNQFHGITVSPDGALIYYVKSHPNDPFAKSLYSMSILGGAARMVINDIDGPISFSPDGKQFVYEHCGPAGIQIRIARVDSDNERQLAVIHDAACDRGEPGPRWSRDGRTIAAPAIMRTDPIRWILACVSVENGRVRTLFESPFAIGRPVWIARDQALLVPHAEDRFTQTQLWTVTFPGGEARRVTDDVNLYNLALDATPDGHTAVSTIRTQVSNIWVVPAEDPHARQVSDGLPLFEGAELADGRVVAVDFDGKLWSMAPDGGQRVPFSNVREVNSFERCGNHVIASVDTGETITYVRLNVDGTHATPLISGNIAVLVYCSGSGSFVFYVRKVPPPYRIFKVPLAGGAAIEVGHNLPVGAVGPLGVSPDETQLAYLERVEGPGVPEGWRVAVVRTADGSPVASWAVRLPAHHPRLFRWSPRGLTWQFLRAEGDVFNVWEQPLSGGAPKQLTKFTSGRIFNFEWSPEGNRLVMTRGSLSRDVVLLSLK